MNARQRLEEWVLLLDDAHLSYLANFAAKLVCDQTDIHSDDFPFDI